MIEAVQGLQIDGIEVEEKDLLDSTNMPSAMRFIEPETTTTDAMPIKDPMTHTSLHFNPKK